MGAGLQRTAAELRSAIDTMFRIRAVESPPDEQGTRSIWHRGAKGADLVTLVDRDGRVSRQELFLFDDYFLFDRVAGLRTGVCLDNDGGPPGPANSDIAFDQDAVLRRKRLQHAAHALESYRGADPFIGHIQRAVSLAASGRTVVSDEPVTRSEVMVRQDELTASQEIKAREVAAALARRRRNVLFIAGAVLLALGTLLLASRWV